MTAYRDDNNGFLDLVNINSEEIVKSMRHNHQ